MGSAGDRYPHPSPLPEGEGTDRGVCSSYTDLQYRAELKICKAPNVLPFPLSLWERAGVRGF
ncbi:hypothetical protein I1A_000467 [Pseudomonas fluorescens R124]|uniref:Uncharacterized protein n=1 Tax=Pseudomonas fluorescens R124 TaxID=743713 RepID=A0A7U9CLR4_PSEFL|nr:hypothetical protein I1A_000467 [Pseudomonas fluorescens R124]